MHMFVCFAQNDLLPSLSHSVKRFLTRKTTYITPLPRNSIRPTLPPSLWCCFFLSRRYLITRQHVDTFSLGALRHPAWASAESPLGRALKALSPRRASIQKQAPTPPITTSSCSSRALVYYS